MGTTKIEWCDRIWNLIAGCAEVSPGCANCYARTMSRRLAAMADAKRQRGNVEQPVRQNQGRLAYYRGVVDEDGRCVACGADVIEFPSEAPAQDVEFKWDTSGKGINWVPEAPTQEEKE